MERSGVGEIVVNSIANDGVMDGYDIPILKHIRDAVGVPLTALGGAGSFDDIRVLVQELGVMGAAAGSLFVFKGSYKAVLDQLSNRDRSRVALQCLIRSL